jgi:hypothetical protein
MGTASGQATVVDAASLADVEIHMCCAQQLL